MLITTSNDEVILYSFRRCPFAMRARMALTHVGMSFQLREISLKDKPQSLLNYSAKGTVPVLLVNHQVLDESLAIMQWALQQNDCNDWLLNNNTVLQKQAYSLIHNCDTKFKPQLDCYKYSDRYPLDALTYRQQSVWFLELLETLLQHNTFLFCDQVSIADVAIFPFIRQYAFVDKIWFDSNGYRHLQRWLNGWLESELFISIMHKHKLWVDL